LRKRLIVVVAFLSLIAAISYGQTLGAVLTPSQEVPATTVSGFGNSTVTFDAARQNITVTITATNLGAAINNFHIHEAPAGVNGPVVVNLIGLGGTFVNGTMTGTFPIDPAVAQRLLQNPSNFYVNVHTTAFPGGAIRGQLAYVSGGSINYAAELRPTNEVPATNSNAFGSAFVTFDPINNGIAWEVDASGIANATLSHIHRAGAGVNGPVIINFATAAGQIPGGRTKGNAAISAQQANAFAVSDLPALYNPTTAIGYYVNVHSSAFPGGEVRGQLVPANEYDIPIAGRVTNGFGQTFVTDVRIFNPSYNAATTALVEYFPAGASGNANASAATVVNIAARGTAVLDDIGNTLGVSGTTGALRVSSANALAVTSRIYADLRASGKGTFGQFVAAQPRANALRRGVMPQLSNHFDPTSGYRTNVGFFNPTSSAVTLRLELRDKEGGLIGQSTLTLQALAQQQAAIGNYFTGVDLTDAANLTLSFDAAAPILAYAAVNDNISGDSIFVAAQPDSGVAASQ
jgi:Cu/Zn superoxide dismutase